MTDFLDERVPPEYRGRLFPPRAGADRWANGAGQSGDLTPSRFPDMTVGVPGEITDEWIDFSLYRAKISAGQHPTCRTCGTGLAEPTIRAGFAVCAPCRKEAPKSRLGNL